MEELMAGGSDSEAHESVAETSSKLSATQLAHTAEQSTPDTRTRNIPAWLVATFFGIGYLKPGPGTYASTAAAILWLVAGWVVHHNTELLTALTAMAVVLATAAGIPASTRVARESGRHDPGFVVIDEVAGQWLALLFVPPLWPNALLAVLFFRFFDILKPPPVRQLERLREGVGIMADDLMAGVFALVCSQLALFLLQKLH